MVHFPIAFLLGAFLMQWIYLITKRFLNPTALAILLTALAALVGTAGHYGGSLTYGSDNFSEF